MISKDFEFFSKLQTEFQVISNISRNFNEFGRIFKEIKEFLRISQDLRREDFIYKTCDYLKDFGGFFKFQ